MQRRSKRVAPRRLSGFGAPLLRFQVATRRVRSSCLRGIDSSSEATSRLKDSAFKRERVGDLRRGFESLAASAADVCEHAFVIAQGSACMRFRRALNRGNVTEALSAASELDFVSLAEALEVTLLLAAGDLEKYNRAALRWHVRFVEETKTSICARVKRCSRSWLQFQPTASQRRHWPSSSAGDDLASESQRLLFAGLGRRRKRRHERTLRRAVARVNFRSQVGRP
jgi:DNA-binding FadR family transcriptional regulator